MTITGMYKDYQQDTDTPSCSFETYRKVLRDMNIAFTTLSGEECSRCSVHLQHMLEEHGVSSKEANHHEQGCDQCEKHDHHVNEAKTARKAYREDADKVWEPSTAYFSADMMKVFMLPQLPLKDAIFTPRLTCFNETFALLMPSRREDRAARRQLRSSMCVIWHDGLAGRGCEEVASAFVLFLTTACRDIKNVVMWFDNCAGQNKSWTLLSTLLKTVHSNATSTETITLKFLEPGHTSMSADAIHQVVSKNLRRAGKVEDLQDYVNETENAGVKVVIMKPGVNMVQTEDSISRHALKVLAEEGERPYLATFKVVQVKRGSTELWTKTSLSDTAWTAYNVVKSTSPVDEQPPIRQTAVTTSRERIEGICIKLTPHMASHKRVFWEQLLESLTRPVSSVAGCKATKRRRTSGCAAQPRRKRRRDAGC